VPQPSTTAELQLEQVVGLLTEIRDLLEPRGVTSHVTISEPAVPAAAASRPTRAHKKS
jgi:hypothetical protein